MGALVVGAAVVGTEVAGASVRTGSGSAVMSTFCRPGLTGLPVGAAVLVTGAAVVVTGAAVVVTGAAVVVTGAAVLVAGAAVMVTGAGVVGAAVSGVSVGVDGEGVTGVAELAGAAVLVGTAGGTRLSAHFELQNLCRDIRDRKSVTVCAHQHVWHPWPHLQLWVCRLC